MSCATSALVRSRSTSAARRTSLPTYLRRRISTASLLPLSSVIGQSSLYVYRPGSAANRRGRGHLCLLPEEARLQLLERAGVDAHAAPERVVHRQEQEEHQAEHRGGEAGEEEVGAHA